VQPERLPFAKLFDTPFITLDETSIELASILFLFVAVIVITNVRRHRQRVRALVQVVSFVVFFFFIYSCLGVFGMIRNGLYGVTLIGTVYSEAFYWMALPLVVLAVTLLWGPIFCGWICPTGTIQEFTTALRRRLVPLRFQGTRLNLVLLAAALSGFVVLCIWLSIEKKMFIEDSSLHWAAALILLCYLVIAGVIDDLPTRALRVGSVLAIVLTTVSHVVITSPVHFAFTARDDPASALSTLILAVASLVVARAWCRYLCPWGWLLGFLHRFSRVKVVRDEAACTHCDHCVTTCEVGAIDATGVRHDACQLCLSCVDKCPSAAFSVVDVWRDSPQRRGLPIVFGAASRR
jgi:polyferredoxin